MPSEWMKTEERGKGPIVAKKQGDKSKDSVSI